MGYISQTQFPVPIPVVDGGTGTSTQFTQGSIPFAGSNGVYAQDNTGLFWDEADKRLGVNTRTPNDEIDVVGTILVRDAATPAKAYRLRTSGGALDFEMGGESLFISVWDNADFSGTQHNYILLQHTGGPAQLNGGWEFRNGFFGTLRHAIDGTSGSNVSFNADLENTSFIVNGTLANLLVASNKSVKLNGGQVVAVTAVNDANYTIVASDYVIAYVALSVGRTATLPTAVGIAGQVYIVKDASGSAATRNITIATTSSQTIDGASTKVISTNYGSVKVYSDGANWSTF